MQRVDLLLLGYFTLKVDPPDLCLVSDIFLKNNVSAVLKRNAAVVIPYKERERVERLLSGRVAYSISGPKGFLGYMITNKKRIGVFFGILAVAFLLLLSSDVVWDVRIEGAEISEQEKILDELSSAGLSVGKRWSKLETSKVEMDMLRDSKCVSWLNINRRGTVAYVKVSDKISHPTQELPTGYANVVASRDCVIEEIIVESGYALVKKGESVRAGQILISGIIPTELGGGVCYARGEVLGRYSDTVTVSVSKEKLEKVYKSEQLSEFGIEFFGIYLNIFKNYRQSQKECDIIIKKDTPTLLKKLPVSFVKQYLRPYVWVSTELSEQEMAELASEQLTGELLNFLSDKEARRLRTDGSFSDGKYTMVCDVVVSANVTKTLEFKVTES